MQPRKELPQTQRQDLWNREQAFKSLRRQQYLSSGRDEGGLEEETESSFCIPWASTSQGCNPWCGEILCKNHPKRPVFDPLLPPGGQPDASPHSQNSDPGEDTRLGPGSGCHCGSTWPGRAVRRSSPRGRTLEGAEPRFWDSQQL